MNRKLIAAGFIILFASVGYIAYLNQDVVVYSIEQFWEFLVGDNATAEWVRVTIVQATAFYSPRWSMNADITASTSQTVYRVNNTIVNTKISFSMSYTVTFQNVENVTVKAEIYATYYDLSNNLVNDPLNSETVYPTSSGYSDSLAYDLLAGSTKWNKYVTDATSDVAFYAKITIWADGLITGASYSDTASEKYFSGSFHTDIEQAEATATTSYTISSWVVPGNVTIPLIAGVIILAAGILYGGKKKRRSKKQSKN